jgi:beta-lactamase regulating signal transducer with metallopeptidase domain
MNMSNSFLASMFPSPLVERIGWLLVHTLWQFALIAGLVLVLARLMRRQSAAVHYTLQTAALLLMVVAPVGSWFLLPPGAGRPAAGSAATTDASRVADDQGLDLAQLAAVKATRAAETLAVQPASEPRPQPANAIQAEPLYRLWWSAAAERLRPWMNVLVIAWSVGVLLFAVRPVLSWFTVRRLRSVGVARADDAVRNSLHRIQQRLAVRRSVQVLQSTLVHAPIVVGCFRSVILLPVSLVTGLPNAQLEAILAHELAHVRRYDYLVNLAQTLVETLYFYHPAVWWLSHRIRLERENCCDDLVVAALGDRVQYGRALLAIEECRGAASVFAVGAGGGSLLARVRRLFAVDPPVERQGTAGIAALSALFACLVGAVIWAAVVAHAQDGVEKKTLERTPAAVPVDDQTANKPVVTIDDELRRVFVPQRALNPPLRETNSSDSKAKTRTWRFRVLDDQTENAVPQVRVRVTPWAQGQDPQEPLIVTGTDDGWLEVQLPDPGAAFLTIVDPRFFDSTVEGLKPQQEPRNRLGIVTWSNEHVFELADANTAPVLRCWRGSRFVGTVLQADGSPAAHATLNVGARIGHIMWMERMGIPNVFVSWDHGQWPNWRTAVITDERGRFETRVPPAQAVNYVRVGSATLSFGALDDTAAREADRNSPLLRHVPFMLELSRDAEQEGTFDAGAITLESGVVLQGRVQREDGSPADGVQVWAEPVVNIRRDAYEFSPHAGRYVLTDENGQFVFAPLRAGPVEVTVRDRERNADGQATSPGYPKTLMKSRVTLPADVTITKFIDVRLRAAQE